MKNLIILVVSLCCTAFATNCSMNTYSPGPVPFGGNAYAGGCYHPGVHQIVFTPFSQTANSTAPWHRIDCTSGSTIVHDHTARITINSTMAAYIGNCAWHTGLDRVYFAPMAMIDNPQWHFVDQVGVLQEYDHNIPGITGFEQFWGAVSCPTQQDVYFIPYNRGSQDWLYVNSTGGVNTYPAGAGFIASVAYQGGALCPNEQKIILAPHGQGSQPQWHYIDCASRSAKNYTHGQILHPAPGSTSAYGGAVYQPSTDRVYFSPRGQAPNGTWHYYECSTGLVKGYPARPGVAFLAYGNGGLLSDDTIVFAPRDQASLSLYDSIDSNGTVNVYAGAAGVTNSFSNGAVCQVGSEPRFYLGPFNGASWQYISCGNVATSSPTTAPTSVPTTAPTGAPTVLTLPPVISNGTVVNGSVVVDTAVDFTQGVLEVVGDLAFTMSASIIISSKTRIIASGDVMISGACVLQQTSNQFSPDTYSFVEAATITGMCDNITTQVVGGGALAIESCENEVYQENRSPMQGGGITGSITLSLDTSGCLPIGAIAGGAAGFAVILAIIVVAIVVKKHMSQKEEQTRKSRAKFIKKREDDAQRQYDRIKLENQQQNEQIEMEKKQQIEQDKPNWRRDTNT